MGAMIEKGEKRKLLKAQASAADSGSGGAMYEKGLNRSKEKNRGGFIGGVEYTAKQAGLSFLRVGEGVLDAALVPIDLITLNGDRAASRFQNSRVEQRQRELQREYAPGKGMEFVGNVTGGLGQSVGYGLISAIPYAGKPMMYSSIVEQSISSAAAKTGKVGAKEIAYGATAGAVEGLLESKLGSGVGAVKKIGSSILKKTGKNVVKTAAKAGGKTMLKSVLAETAKGAAGEFAEEAISEAVDPALQRLYGIDKNASTSFKDIMYAGVVGGVSGGLISAGPAVINYNSAVSAGRSIQERGLDKDLIKRARATVDGMKKAQADAEVKISAKPVEGETAEDRKKRTKDKREARRFSKETKELVDKMEKNIAAYEQLIADPIKAKSSAAAAVLGELRGNVFLAAMSVNVDTMEAVMMAADDKNRQLFVDAINERLAADGNEKHDYTLADFDADKDHIRRRLAGELALEDMLGIAVEDGEEATQEAAEATTSPWEGLSDNEDMSGYKAAGEAENALLKAAVRESVPRGSVQAMLDEYRKGTNLTPEEFAEAWSDGVHKYGRYGFDIKDAADTALGRMESEAREAAIKYGRETAEAETKAKDEAAKKKKNPAPKPEGKEKREGKATLGESFEGKQIRDALPKQEQFEAYKAAEILANTLGTDIVIEATLADTAGKTTNGYYNRKTNAIHININAMRGGKNVALYTLSHEATHYIKEWSPAKFKALSDFVMKHLGGDAENLIDEKLTLLRKIPDYKDYTVAELTDLAAEEVVADGMELVLTDGKVLEELAQTDKTLFEKIKDWIADVIDKIRKYYGELNQVSKTAQVLKETVESLEEIERMFTEGVKEAGERARTAGVEAEIAGDGGKKFQAQPSKTNPQQLDPRTVTREDVEKLLEAVKAKEIYGDTYFPVRINTPSILIEYARKKVGDVIDNQPIAMSAKKAYQAMARKGQNVDGTPHNLQVGEMISIIESLNDPEYIVYQSENDRYVMVVGYETQNKKKAFAILEIGNDKNAVYMNGYEGGLYNIFVTAFSPEQGKLNELLKSENNIIVFDKKKDAPQRTSSSRVPSVLNDTPFADSVPQESDSVNRKFSISEENSSDTAYLSAVNRGDMETAQKMVDEAAKAEGYKIKAYHGTNAEFTVFDKNRVGKGIDQYGAGFYFASNADVTERYGNRKYDVYLSLKKPIRLVSKARGEGKSLYDVKITQTQAYKILKKHPMMYDREESPLGDFYDDYWEVGPKEWMIKDLAKRYTNIGDLDADVILYRNYPNELHEAIREVIGYDGVEVYFESDAMVDERNDYFYVAWFDNQMKSADPVTYDDNGNVIPLSERFKEDDSDIRYSIDETPETPDVSENATDKNVGDTEDEISDRDLLLAMAERLVGSEEENRILTNYKTNYDTQKARQARLDELAAEMREQQSIMMYDQSAEKRSAAAKRLPDIYKEMGKISQQLADADRKLTEIEGMRTIRNLIRRERLAVRDTYKNKYETMYKRRNEARDTTETRRSVRRLYNRVNRLLFSPSKTRNVPIGMQGLVAEALRAANVDAEAIERLGRLEEQLAAMERDPAPDMAKMADLEAQIEEQERRVGKVKDQVNMLIEIFEATGDKDADGETRLVFDDAVLQKLKDLRAEIGNASIRNMDRKQLLALNDFYKMIWHRIKTANNTLASNRKLKVNKAGEQSSREVRDSKYLKILSPKSMELVGAKAARKYIWSILKPLTAFEAIGSDTFMGLFREVLNGENTWARDLEEAYNVIKASKEKHGYDDWNMIERKTVKTADGDVELSLSEIMSLYAYSFREQAESHLMGGGFVLDPNATARVKGKKLSFMELERRLNNPTRYTLTEAQIRTLGDYLTESQRAYVEDVQRYLTDMGEKGNEVSRKLYGIDIFREKHYFPIKVESEYLESQTGKTGDPKIKNRGMTKEIVPEAKNPLVLQDFMAVAGDHINSMATYHAFVLPVEDLTRVLNFKPTNVKLDKDGNPILDENGMPVADTDATVKYDTLKSEIEAKYGAEAVSYIEQMIRDLNGGARRDAAATLLDQGLTAFKRATTMLSLSTIIQQPTSIFRAMAYVDAKWFTGAKMYDYDTIKKYAPVAIMKEIGGFDTGTGIRTAEYLNSKEYKTFKDKLKAIAMPEAYGGDPAYRAEAFGWLTGKADENTWRYMFGAIVNEQAAKLGKPADSEAVLKAAGERFSDVVRRTQVYDSTLTRSEIMRSKDTGAKLLTQFAAEPTTVVSMIVDGLIKAERGDKAFFRKTAAAVATSIIINAMASSLIYAMRDDDEDKNFIEKYTSSLTGELIEGFNPLEYLPFFRDIMSIFKGYDVERSDMTLIGNLFDQIELITSSKRSFADKLFGVTGAVTAFFGVPVTNVYRDVKGVITTGASFVDSEPVTGRGLSGAVNEGVKSQYNLIYKLFGAEEGNAYELYKAAVSGDAAHYDRVAARYSSASAAEQALRKELRENDRRIAEAAEAKASGELDVYESLIDKIEAEGHFDRNLIIRAINNEVLELRDAANQATAAKDENPETEDEETADEALYTATDLTDAMERGDTDDYAAVYDYLVAYKVEQGKTEAQAKSSIKSSVTAKYKRLYLAAWEQNDTAAMKRILALLEQTGLYGSYNDTAKTVEKWVRESAK